MCVCVNVKTYYIRLQKSCHHICLLCFVVYMCVPLVSLKDLSVNKVYVLFCSDNI